MLAPVLARLDAVPGVRRSRTEASGRFVLLELSPRADPRQVEAAARRALGREARRLRELEVRQQLAARRSGDPWLAAGEVVALSYVEGRILSARVSAEVARRAGLEAGKRDLLAEALRLEIFAALERAHAQGGHSSGGWFYQAWPAVAAAALRRCRPRLGPLGPLVARAVRPPGPARRPSPTAPRRSAR